MKAGGRMFEFHASSHRNPKAFLGLIAQTSPSKVPRNLFPTEINRVGNHSCRSLTLHADGRTQRSSTGNDGPVDVGVGLALSLAPIPHCLPNLRRISISHTDWSHGHISQHLRLRRSPPQAGTHLSLAYAFTTASKDLARHLHLDTPLQWICRPGMEMGLGTLCAFFQNLRHLALAGVPTPFPGLMLRHHKQMAAWALEIALFLRPSRGGASAAADWTVNVDLQPVRIVVRSETLEPVVFIELLHECKRFDVELTSARAQGFSEPGRPRSAPRGRECVYGSVAPSSCSGP
ncbi:hypothetical protein V8D89_006657 [Ganoderma adspersum]